MPSRDNEREWEAVIRAIDPKTPRAEMAGKIAAAWIYHQYELHGMENNLDPKRKQRYMDETFALLSDEERRVLDETHHFMVKHTYTSHERNG